MEQLCRLNLAAGQGKQLSNVRKPLRKAIETNTVKIFNLLDRIKRLATKLQLYVDRIWYPPLLGLAAALDNFLVVIPNDGLLISSSMLMPKRWFALAACVAVGSTIGAFFLAGFVETKGLSWILHVFPDINTTTTWLWTQTLFEQYGLLIVFVVAITPLAQQPVVILASLAETPLNQLVVAIFTGRFVKFLVMAYLGSHAPRQLAKLWGVRDELKEVGVKIE